MLILTNPFISISIRRILKPIRLLIFKKFYSFLSTWYIIIFMTYRFFWEFYISYNHFVFFWIWFLFIYKICHPLVYNITWCFLMGFWLLNFITKWIQIWIIRFNHLLIFLYNFILTVLLIFIIVVILFKLLPILTLRR